jgi:anti-sigma factor RsiW
MNKVHEGMPDIVAEQLSAWFDDELPEAELELLIARLARNTEAHRQLGRYGLIGAALCDGASVPDARQLGDRVRRALDAEAGTLDGLPAPIALERRWQSNIVPFAAAATVLLTLFVMATLKSPSPVPVADAGTGRSGLFIPVAVAAERLRPQQFEPSTRLSRQRLTDYLVWHGEYTGTFAVQAADSRIVNDRGYAAAVRTRFEYPVK